MKYLLLVLGSLLIVTLLLWLTVERSLWPRKSTRDFCGPF
jgi:hypothetical protein